VESDQLIVAMKFGNSDGAKGLAREPRGRDTFSGHRTGTRKSTKLDPMTYSMEGEEVLLKSRMREICTSGSVRGLVVDSGKEVATRPTRPGESEEIGRKLGQAHFRDQFDWLQPGGHVPTFERAADSSRLAQLPLKQS
jgi:hypothetical protein